MVQMSDRHHFFKLFVKGTLWVSCLWWPRWWAKFCPTAFDSLIISSKLNPAHTILLPHTEPSSQDKCFTTWTSIKLRDIFWLNIWIVYEDKTRYFLPKTSQSLLTLTKCFLCLNLTRPMHSVVATWHWKLNLRKCKNWQISSCLQKHKHI